MNWKTFWAINQRIVAFRNVPRHITLPNVVGWFGAVIGAVVSFSGGFDWFAPRALARVTDRTDLVQAWQLGHHWSLKALVTFLLFSVAYLLVFSVQACVLLSEKEDRPEPTPDPDEYRRQLAEKLGITFTRVRDYYDVTNENGDCFVIHEAAFVVGDLGLAHVERKLGSESATSRGAPLMEVPLHPPDTRPSTQADTSSSQRVYHFRFQPAISHTGTESMVRLTEEMGRGVWMWREDVPFSQVLGGSLESISHLVNEPTDKLELEVAFPRGYTIAGDRNFKVRLGTTENAHAREEQRLERAEAISNRLENERQILKLTVEKPVMGLCYFLCWIPRTKSEKSGKGHA